MSKKILISALLFFGIVSSSYALNNSALLTSFKAPITEKSNQERKGDSFYFVFYFEKAIKAYTEVKSNLLTLDGKRRLAESYQNMGQNIESEAIYAELIQTNSELLPEDYLNYAMILKTNGKQNESNLWMEKFATLKPADLRAKSYLSNKGNLTQMLKNDGSSKVLNMNINSPSADFAPTYYKNNIVFTSSRKTNKIFQKKYNWNRQSFCNVYVSEKDGIQLKNAQSFTKSINSKMHDGPVSFSNGGNFMAFTKNHYKDKSKDRIVELQIFFSDFSNGKWSTPEAFIFNNEAFSVGQPCLSSNGKSMYFTSNMPGGFGGSDLYLTNKDAQGVWGKPINLGNEVNTEGDEMFPFFEEQSKTLYFSSNGHYGLGGFDIFSNTLNSTKTLHLGSPVNTINDDFALIVDSTTTKGYFSSNRVGGNGDDDIYSLEMTKKQIQIEIKGVAKDINNQALPFTFITLKDSEGNIVDSLKTEDLGLFSFILKKDMAYEIIGNKVNYIEGNELTNTFGNDTLILLDVILLQEEIKVNDDLAKVIDLDPIYFDFAAYAIRPDAAIQLDKIVKIMNQYPSMEIELGSHTDCRGENVYNGFLSDYRATTSVNYIKSRITNPSRISGKGFGETKLLNDCPCGVKSNCSQEEHQLNRRTEFIVRKPK